MTKVTAGICKECGEIGTLYDKICQDCNKGLIKLVCDECMKELLKEEAFVVTIPYPKTTVSLHKLCLKVWVNRSNLFM